jgi:hypothetical protein
MSKRGAAYRSTIAGSRRCTAVLRNAAEAAVRRNVERDQDHESEDDGRSRDRPEAGAPPFESTPPVVPPTRPTICD